jgi:hypothetical protein
MAAPSSAGGADGVIDQDALGLDRIYVQTKRYADGNTVGRETAQAFVGALHGVGPSRIILIDSARLVSLMIKYRPLQEHRCGQLQPTSRISTTSLTSSKSLAFRVIRGIPSECACAAIMMSLLLACCGLSDRTFAASSP